MRNLQKHLLVLPSLLAGLAALVILFGSNGVALAEGNSFLRQHTTINAHFASTVPDNGDVNPYGVAVVPDSHGRLVAGHVLVSNFNNSNNKQGTGTTIVQISPDGSVSLFAKLDPAQLSKTCPGGVGLTTALVVLQRGWVIVGSLPAAGGDPTQAKAGCLIVLNSWGQPVETFSGGGINGPWDMTAFDRGHEAALFVTNVLNGTVAANFKPVDEGTVLRIKLNVPEQGQGVPSLLTPITEIASGFPETLDLGALVIGPTGVGLGSDDTLYVADTLDSQITAIPHALTHQSSEGIGKIVSADTFLNGPLGLAIAPNGNILTVNSGDGFIVETTPGGTQIAHELLDDVGSPPGAGNLFGLAIIGNGAGVYFVDDRTNTLNTLT